MRVSHLLGVVFPRRVRVDFELEGRIGVLYRPVNVGFRFSAKADRPSGASSEVRT